MKYYFFMLITVAVDQITKFLVRNNMDEGESIPIIGEFFKIHYIENTGAAFSLFQDMTIFLIVFPSIVVVISFLMLEKYRKKEHFTLLLSLSLIIAGGIGNLIDRVIFSSVTDMLSFSIFPPIFNFADISVCVGCGFTVLYIMVYDGKRDAGK